MSWINLGEVFYVVQRAAGAERRERSSATSATSSPWICPPRRGVLEAAAIKVRHQLAYAYADAFAIATALSHRASLLTADPEILDHGDPTWAVIDLRSSWCHPAR